jgi:predicted DNA-binding protein (UPF0251 family)
MEKVDFKLLRKLLIAPQMSVQQAMIKHDIPEALMVWTENMLEGRNIVYQGRNH